LALDVGEWSSSCPSSFIARERASSTLLIGVWVVPRARLDVVLKRKISASASNQILVVHPIA